MPAEGPLPIHDCTADFAICFNALDHVQNPEEVLKELFRICKPGAELNFQVFVYASEEEMKQKSGHHAELHPCSFTRESIIGLLRRVGFLVQKHDCGSDANAENEYFFVALSQKPTS